MKKLFYFIFIGLILSSCSTVKVKEERKIFGPCGISLNSISKTAGFPGDVIELFGQWGDSQEGKLPNLYKGRPNNLEVISWSDSIIKVKIPQGLDAGNYKAGVFCNDPAKGVTYSSGWIKFEIISSPPKPTYPTIKGSSSRK